ncbi:MAG: hypothetical protein ABJ327_21980 [Litoreibacter sp.]
MNKHFRGNRAQLAEVGILSPAPRDYRAFLRDYVWRSNCGPGDQSEALAAFGCPSQYHGIALSNDQALSARETLLERGEFLFWAESRIQRLGELFEDHRIMFLIEVENFATFLPRLSDDLEPDSLAGIATWDMADFSWMELVSGLSASCPNAEFVIAPTEILSTNFYDIVSKLTVGAALPKPNTPKQITRDKVEAFQLAIGSRMAEPLTPELAAKFEDVLGWSEEIRINLSRQYYSEVLALYHEHTVLI